MTTVKCPNCGRKIYAQAAECPSCGMELSYQVPEQFRQSYQQQPGQAQQQYQQQYQPQNRQQDQYPQPYQAPQNRQANQYPQPYGGQYPQQYGGQYPQQYGGQYPQQYNNQYYQGRPYQPYRSNDSYGISLAALICAFIFPLLGLILGIIGLKTDNPSHRSMCKAAIIIASVYMALAAIFFFVIVNNFSFMF